MMHGYTYIYIYMMMISTGGFPHVVHGSPVLVVVCTVNYTAGFVIR